MMTNPTLRDLQSAYQNADDATKAAFVQWVAAELTGAMGRRTDIAEIPARSVDPVTVQRILARVAQTCQLA
jgi:hypothetical protein